MKEMWDKRYASNEYVYGEQPNEFFKAILNKYNLNGSVLLAAEGEGRNAVYAAKKGMDVVAFDISEEGKKKALRLADKRGVSFDYHVGDFLEMPLKENSFDVVALIFAHFPTSIRLDYYKKMIKLVKPGGVVILEGFSTNHLEWKTKNPNAGGPDNIDMLFSITSIKRELAMLDILELDESVVELREGSLHCGSGSVVCFVGRKPIS